MYIVFYHLGGNPDGNRVILVFLLLRYFVMTTISWAFLNTSSFSLKISKVFHHEYICVQVENRGPIGKNAWWMVFYCHKYYTAWSILSRNFYFIFDAVLIYF